MMNDILGYDENGKIKTAKVAIGSVGVMPDDDFKVYDTSSISIKSTAEIAKNNSQIKIAEITDAIKDLLLYKNKQYGDSALQPNNIFYKGSAVTSIMIRLDDKIGRIKK